jgi:FixJ family two-component response regulator
LSASKIVSVVDDDLDVRLALSTLLRSHGWTVSAFESAEDFLRSGACQTTAFLISDIRMPGLSGLDMYTELVNRGCTPPTVFITAFPSPELEQRVSNVGGLGLLSKPFDFATIMPWLTAALGRP